MKRVRQTSLAGAAVLALAVGLRADVPQVIHYQGKLRDAGGAAVSGTVSVRFRLYEGPTSETPVLFDESHSTVTVTNGLFSALLGSTTVGGVPDAALDAADVWLGVSINIGDEMSPRSRIGSSAHAVKARSAEQLVRPGTFETAVTVDVGGNVGIGTTSPEQALDVSFGGIQFADDTVQTTAAGPSLWQENGGDIYYDAGRVGVGNNSPTARLDVYADSGDILRASGAVQPGAPDWLQVTASSGWYVRASHSSVVYDGKMWVMGGDFGWLNYLADVWYSTDGASWTQATASAAWGVRSTQTSVVHDGKMWVMGGDRSARLNDSWYSVNGVNWTLATGSAAWSPRNGHASITYGGAMWVTGGSFGGFGSDVYRSTDGASWTTVTGAAAWPVRYAHAMLEFDGRMWVMGGYGLNDVWHSTNGASWTQATASAGWCVRSTQTSVVHDGKMWIMGGLDSVVRNDVWTSTDGASWTQVTSAAAWPNRGAHTSLVYDNSIWIFGGNTNWGVTYDDDVWRLTEAMTQPMFVFTGDGNLGIGTASPTYPVQLSGGAYCDGSSWVNASSAELKQDVTPLSETDAMAVLKALDPVRFRYKDRLDDECLGFLAEQVPALAATADRKGVSAMDIAAVLTRVIQTQQRRIEALEQKLRIED